MHGAIRGCTILGDRATPESVISTGRGRQTYVTCVS